MSPARIGRSSDGEHLADFEPAADGRRRCAPPAAPPASVRACLVQRRPGLGRRRPAPASRSARSRPARRGPTRCATCRIGVAEAVSARRARAVGEDAVDRRQQRLDGAERQVERHAPPVQARRAARCRRTPRPCAANMCGRGALEAVDRLLLVADGEQRARHRRARRCRRRTPRPARGSPATARGSCPAPRRPGCGRGRRRACRAPTRPPPTSASRLGGLADQVLEVERGAARLGVAVALQHGAAEPQQRHGRVDDASARLRSLVQGDEARLRARASSASRSGCASAEPLRHQALARLAVAGAGRSSRARSTRPAGRAGSDGRCRHSPALWSRLAAARAGRRAARSSSLRRQHRPARVDVLAGACRRGRRSVAR